MSFPKEWNSLEKKFDQDELIEPKDNTIASLPEFCLSDFYIHYSARYNNNKFFKSKITIILVK